MLFLYLRVGLSVYPVICSWKQTTSNQNCLPLSPFHTSVNVNSKIILQSSGDDQIELALTPDKLLKISKKQSDEAKMAPLIAARWNLFQKTIKAHEVQAVLMEKVNIGHCCEQVFDFIVQCNNMTRLFVCHVKDEVDSDREVVTGLIKALPRLGKLKEIDIFDVNMGIAGPEVFNVFNSQDLRILILKRTCLSGAVSSLTSALQRFPDLSFLDLFESGLTDDESLSVLDILPSSCPNIVHLSIYPEKFTSEQIKPVGKLEKLISFDLNFETTDDKLTALGKFPQPLEMIRLHDDCSIAKKLDDNSNTNELDERSIPNELDKFLSMIRDCPKLHYLVVNEGVLDYEGKDRVSKVMARKGGRLVVVDKESQGFKEYLDQIDKMKNECSSS